MLALDMLRWWYGAGLAVLGRRIKESLVATLDTFSFGTLLRTLFAPFRQIDAGANGRSIGEKLQAFLARTLSRLIGAMVRLFLLVTGILVLILKAVLMFLLAVLWPLLPVLPAVLVVCATVGVGA